MTDRTLAMNRMIGYLRHYYHATEEELFQLLVIAEFTKVESERRRKAAPPVISTGNEEMQNIFGGDEKHWPRCLRESCNISRPHVHFQDWRKRAKRIEEEGRNAD